MVSIIRALAGEPGILAERSPFRGRTRSDDVDAYITQILSETDMRLGVCDWGYCLYCRETSACLGRDDLDSESRALAETRIDECRRILGKLDEGRCHARN